MVTTPLMVEMVMTQLRVETGMILSLVEKATTELLVVKVLILFMAEKGMITYMQV